jgi:hypothetical protein
MTTTPNTTTPTAVSLQTADGHYVCAEGGGGTTVTANRTEEGPWELWDVLPRDGGLFALRSSGGYYLGIEADHTVTINRREVGEWEEWEARYGETDGSVTFRNHYSQRYLSAVDGGGSGLVADREAAHAWECFCPSEDFLAPDVPDVPSVADPIVGQLTTDGDRCYRDDQGPRILCCYHAGDLFALFCAGRTDKVREVLAEVAQAGYHVVRSWVCLNDANDPDNVWAGPDYLGVGPTHTPDYAGQVMAFAQLLGSFGLRWHMAAGGLDGMTTAQEEAMFRSWADAMDGAGAHHWALVEALNEARDTGDGDGDNTPEHLEHLINIVRDRHPQVLYCLTSYTGTEDPELLEPYQPSWVRLTYYHGYRGGEIDDKVRHRVSMALESGLGRLFWDGEPGGPWNQQGIPGDPLTSVSAQDNDHEYDDESVAAMHMGTVIGHGVPAFMSSTGVRHHDDPHTFPGFVSTPRLLRLIPDDAHTGEVVHAGRSNSPIEPTTNADGHIGRADSLLLPDGRVVSLLYGERPGDYHYRLRQGLVGDLIHPATGESTPVDLAAGQTWTIAMNWARVFVGRSVQAATQQTAEERLSLLEFYAAHLRGRVDELEGKVRKLARALDEWGEP